MMRWIPEVTEVHNPNENTDHRDDLGKHVTKVIEFALKRRLFGDLRRDRLVNITNCSTLTSENDDSFSVAIDNAGALSYDKIRVDSECE